MYVVRLREVTEIRSIDGAIYIDSDVVKTRVYFRESNAFRRFEKWSRFVHEERPFLAERGRATLKEAVRLLINKKLHILSPGTGTVQQFDQGVAYVEFP